MLMPVIKVIVRGDVDDWRYNEELPLWQAMLRAKSLQKENPDATFVVGDRMSVTDLPPDVTLPRDLARCLGVNRRL